MDAANSSLAPSYYAFVCVCVGLLGYVAFAMAARPQQLCATMFTGASGANNKKAAAALAVAGLRVFTQSLTAAAVG